MSVPPGSAAIDSPGSSDSAAGIVSKVSQASKLNTSAQAWFPPSAQASTIKAFPS